MDKTALSCSGLFAAQSEWTTCIHIMWTKYMPYNENQVYSPSTTYWHPNHFVPLITKTSVHTINIDPEDKIESFSNSVNDKNVPEIKYDCEIIPIDYKEERSSNKSDTHSDFINDNGDNQESLSALEFSVSNEGKFLDAKDSISHILSVKNPGKKVPSGPKINISFVIDNSINFNRHKK